METSRQADHSAGTNEIAGNHSGGVYPWLHQRVSTASNKEEIL